jgi:hypothetical protein
MMIYNLLILLKKKELTEKQKRRVATANEINQMYQKLLSTGLSWDEIKKIACEDKDEAEKIRNDFNELFKEVPDIDPIKHEVRALLVLMGIFYEPKAIIQTSKMVYINVFITLKKL